MTYLLDNRQCPECGQTFARKSLVIHIYKLSIRRPVATHRMNRAALTPLPTGNGTVNFEPFVVSDLQTTPSAAGIDAYDVEDTRSKKENDSRFTRQSQTEYGRNEAAENKQERIN